MGTGASNYGPNAPETGQNQSARADDSSLTLFRFNELSTLQTLTAMAAKRCSSKMRMPKRLQLICKQCCRLRRSAGLSRQLTRLESGLRLEDYRGSGPALPDLMSGRVQVMFDPIGSSIAYIRAGKLRPLGVTNATWMDVLPDVPPISDFVPGYLATGWTGIGAPANTSSEVIEILNREVNAALADPTFRARLAEFGWEPFANSPAEFSKFIVEYIEKWGRVIRAAGIKAE
jgi:hypothetical protein